MFAKYSRSGIALMAGPLYAGPVLAGWSGGGWPDIFPFATLFFLMQLFRGIETKRGDLGLGVFLLVTALTQILVVALAMGAGLALSALTGPLSLPGWLPIGLTALGAAIGVWRYRFDPNEDATMDVLDQALATLETGAEVSTDDADAATSAGSPEAYEQAFFQLLALSSDASAAQIDLIVQRLEETDGADAFRLFLADIGEGDPQIDRGFLRYLASPAIRRALTQTGELGFALSCLLDSDTPGVRHDLLCSLETLLNEDAPPHALPPAPEVRAAAQHWPELAPLADRIAAVQT